MASVIPSNVKKAINEKKKELQKQLFGGMAGEAEKAGKTRKPNVNRAVKNVSEGKPAGSMKPNGNKKEKKKKNR